MKVFSFSKWRKLRTVVSGLLLVGISGCLFLTFKADQSRKTGQGSFLHQITVGISSPVTQEFKIQIITKVFESYLNIPAGTPVAAIGALMVSTHEHNIFYVLTTIHAP